MSKKSTLLLLATKRSTKSISGLWNLNSMCFLLGIFCMLGNIGCSYCEKGDSQLIEEEGEVVFRSILTFWAEDGRLPSSLSECDQKAHSESFGPWIYTMIPDPPRFVISLGDYSKCGWEVNRSFVVDWAGSGEESEREIALHHLQKVVAASLADDWGMVPMALPQVPLGWECVVKPASGTHGLGYSGQISVGEEGLKSGGVVLRFKSQDWYHDS